MQVEHAYASPTRFKGEDIMVKEVYMDNSATTKVAKRVFEEMLPYFKEKYGNAGSLHSKGQEAAEAVSIARDKIAKLINADPKEIIFTSGGTESDNTAIKQIMWNNKGKHFITTKFEHPAVLDVGEYLEKNGFSVTYIDVDEKGLVNPKDIEEAITSETVLVSVMHANNEIGTIQPIEEIGKICRENKIYFHTDAVQTVGKIPIDVKELNVDLLYASSHKLHGPKGIGFLYVRKGVQLIPLMHGGGHEFKKRSGTENVPGIIGFSKACAIAIEEMEENSEKMKALREKLIEGILEKIPKSYVNGDREKRLPNNVHVRFDFIEGEALLIKLDMRGVMGSTGSACSTKSLSPSHVLMSLGLKPVQAHGSLRLTLSKYNTEEEVDYAIEEIAKVVCELRQISPLHEGNIDSFDETEDDHHHDIPEDD